MVKISQTSSTPIWAYGSTRPRISSPKRIGTRLELEAHTHWPRGMRLLGRVVESIVLSGHEAQPRDGAAQSAR
jgi:hypothetical protein